MIDALGIDENRSAWIVGKPSYEPLAALSADTSADVAVIGGGFAGVSTALHLAERFPERRIILLEARTLANGASGRNGGLVLNWVNGVDTGDLDRARAIWTATNEGIDLIAQMIERHGLDIRFARRGCLEAFTDARRADAAAAEVEKLRGAGIGLEFLTGRALDGRLRLAGVTGAVFDPRAGQIDGVALVRGLRPVLVRLGVAVYENTPVLAVKEGATIRLTTPAGVVNASAIVLATNAYTPRLGYFKHGICPVHSHVVATEPQSPDVWQRVGWRDASGFSDDLDRIAFGGMTERGELVFGGGSNAAYGYLWGSRTAWTRSPDRAFAAVERKLREYLPGASDVKIAHRWTGPVALTLSRVCTMGVLGEHRNVYFAVGFSGHGITLANLAGRVLCDVYSGSDERWRGLPFFQQRLLTIAPEPFRWIGYHVYSALTGKSPRRSL